MAFFLLLLAAILFAWFWWEKRQRITHPMAGGIHEAICLPFEQEYELYHNDLSLCSKKVRVCLAELDVDYKPHPVDLIETGSYETLSRHFLAVNPAGILPVLVHKGHPVYESHDIISYLAARCSDPDRQLLPTDAASMATMQQWTARASMLGDDPLDELDDSAAACTAVLTVPLFAAGIAAIPYHRILEGVLFHRIRFRALMFLGLKLLGLKRLYKVAPLVEAQDRAKCALAIHLQALEAQLSDERTWIVGEQFTLADVSWMVLFARLLEADWFQHFLGGEHYPRVNAYWQRLQLRHSYRAGVENFRHPTVAEATHRIRQEKRLNPDYALASSRGCPVTRAATGI